MTYWPRKPEPPKRRTAGAPSSVSSSVAVDPGQLRQRLQALRLYHLLPRRLVPLPGVVVVLRAQRQRRLALLVAVPPAARVEHRAPQRRARGLFGDSDSS